ncbi:hypothetical protein CEXT_810251 [Caerostris extrusa]|uniref:Ribosomal protein S14 n=1 Tax=Caerostris extrusa TaxID=172846 RepID=A0AAV4UDA2_CAEEX|nr:hypothetical protein CEXT_810251 [Caerostris extrusa]
MSPYYYIHLKFVAKNYASSPIVSNKKRKQMTRMGKLVSHTSCRIHVPCPKCVKCSLLSLQWVAKGARDKKRKATDWLFKVKRIRWCLERGKTRLIFLAHTSRYVSPDWAPVCSGYVCVCFMYIWRGWKSRFTNVGQLGVCWGLKYNRLALSSWRAFLSYIEVR